MKYIILICVVLFTFTSCKKTIEKAQEEVVIEAITNGYWTVTKFMRGSTDVTNDFSAYKFKFNENSTVDAVKNNVMEKSGSWQTNTANRTITAQFANATVPLLLLNGTWSITNSTWTSVNATQTINNEIYLLQLNKQ